LLLSSSRSTAFSPQIVAVDCDFELAVLSTSALDDVHVSHDLDPADQRLRDRRRQGRRVVERAINSEADPDSRVLRFDVDIGGALADGLGDDPLHDLHDRRVVVELFDSRRGSELERRLGADGLGVLLEAVERAVCPVDHGVDVRCG
jgi:hypothetical protein